MTINNLQWEILYDKNINENYLGETDYFKLKININPEIENSMNLGRTVMHEVIHAYLYSFGFSNKNEFQLEEMIEFISHNIENINKLTEIALTELNKTKNKEI